MRRIIFIILWSILYFIPAWTQDCKYVITEAGKRNNEEVEIVLSLYCNDKSSLEKEATFAVLKTIMFDGIPNTPFNRPFFKDGYQSTYSENPTYFQILYNNTSSDYITSIDQLTKFKKGPGKSTEFRVVARPLKLRRNLEKNGILKHIGI